MEQEVLKVRFKKLVENAVIPTYKTVGAAGMDITAISTEVIDYGNQLKAYTGIAVEIPKGYVGLLFPRSSNSKKDLTLANSVGIIDSHFRGEVTFRYKVDATYDRIVSEFSNKIVLITHWVDNWDIEKYPNSEKLGWVEDFETMTISGMCSECEGTGKRSVSRRRVAERLPNDKGEDGAKRNSST